MLPHGSVPRLQTHAATSVGGESDLTDVQRQYVVALVGLCPEIRLMRFLAQEFRRTLRERHLHAAWKRRPGRKPPRSALIHENRG